MEIGFESIWNNFIDLLPNVTSAIIVLVIGWAIGRIAGRLISIAIERSGLNKLIRNQFIGRLIESSGLTPCRFFDLLTRWVIYLIALFVAIDILQIQMLSAFKKNILEYLPNFIVGIAILIFGFTIAEFIGNFVSTLSRESKIIFPVIIGNLVRLVLYFVVLTIALTQMKLEVEILYIFANALAWGVAIGLGIGFGIAFGWGFKDIIAKKANRWLSITEESVRCYEEQFKKKKR
jgi:hypothetical protein